MNFNLRTELALSELRFILQPNFDFVSQEFSNKRDADLEPVKSDLTLSFVRSIIRVKGLFQNEF